MNFLYVVGFRVLVWSLLIFWWLCVCRDKSTAGHSLSLKETVEVASVEINGAIAHEISGMIVYDVFVVAVHVMVNVTWNDFDLMEC